ncbi:TPA: pilin, partial [Neisseria gonorrhoeae]
SHCGIRIIGRKNPASVIPAKAGIRNVKSEETVFPISFRADKAGFPPARE